MKVVSSIFPSRGIITSLLLLLLLLVSHTTKSATTSSTTSKTDSKSSSTQSYTLPFRMKHLDHWDAKTICAYLNIDPTTFQPLPTTKASSSSSSSRSSLPDVAILLYSQWCPNCHALAPLYDQIATILNAGTASSNLIMALFDCEKSTNHAKLCNVIGVTGYPTILYASQHAEYRDSDVFTRLMFGKKKAGGPMGVANLKQTVKFQGDWRYGEEIMDWLSVMGGISSWRKWVEERKGRGGGGLLGNLFFGSNAKQGEEMLPVGVPPELSIKEEQEKSNDGGVDVAMAKIQLEAMKQEKDNMELEKDNMKTAATHAGLILDSMLFAPSINTNATNNEEQQQRDDDVFRTLKQDKAWESSDGGDHHVLKSCTVDLALDYCTRYYLHVALETLEGYKTENDTDNKKKSDETVLEDAIATSNKEPYCEIIETCIISNFKKEECRPDQCPFENQFGCRYVNACSDKRIQKEYREAMGLEDEKDENGKGDAAAAGAKVSPSPSAGAWGLG